jgi:hypothetical protein
MPTRPHPTPRSAARLLPAAALALGLALAAPAPPAAAEEAERRPRRVERLGVNSGMGFRWEAVKSEALGARDLVEAAATADFEEIYAFIPDQERWVEVGCCEEQTEGGNYVGLEVHVLKLMREHPRLVIYHIHGPSRFVRENYHELRRRLQRIQEALPSVTDMTTMAKLSRLHRRLHPEGSMAWRIASRHGLTTYGLAPEALASEKVLEYGRFAFAPYEEEELGSMPDDLAAVRRAIEAQDGEPFEISFRPLP